MTVSSDALSQIIRDGYEHDCGSAACDVCGLGPLVGESREQWMARLKDRFRGQPELFKPVADAQRRVPPRPVMVPCPVCGKPKPLNGRCIGCVRRASSKYRDIVTCRRCAGPKMDGLPCGLCKQTNQPRGRGAA